MGLLLVMKSVIANEVKQSHYQQDCRGRLDSFAMTGLL